MGIEALKSELASVASATDIGFDAGGDQVEAIKRLAAELEALNPTAEPSRAGDLLKGRWTLIYSSFGLQKETTLARLSFNALPKTPIRVTALWQEVDPVTGLYDNIVDHETGSVVTLGHYSPTDAHRLDVRFTDIRAMGEGAARVPIDNDKIPPLWSDVVYLDEGFRLNRGSFGSLYVLRRTDPAPIGWARDG